MYDYLSQGHLNLLKTCPPQFAKIYWQKKLEPHHLKYQEKANWGKSFHLLMQQYNLGLNIENIDRQNETLLTQVQATINQTKDIWFSPEVIFREAEYQLNYKIDNYIFTVVYDLLVLYNNKARIIDWKTYRQPQDKQKLIDNWQTKLYLYLLGEKFNYPPSQISFEYWFVSSSQQIEQYSLTYSNDLREQIKAELENLLTKFQDLKINYYQQNLDYPHHSNCHTCPYHHLFHCPDTQMPSSDESIISFEDIEAIEI